MVAVKYVSKYVKIRKKYAHILLKNNDEFCNAYIATTRFEDYYALNCGLRWFKKFGIALYDVMMTLSKAWEKCGILQKRHFFEPKLHHEGMK